MSRVAPGQAMAAEHLAKLGQSSLVTEWGRQGHSFVRYGIGSAQVLGGSAQAAHLMETLDAAASAGMYVLINLGVDELAHKRLGVKSKQNHTQDENVTADELWSWMKGNLTLVADHPAVGAFYGCDDCCHMDVISEYGMGEMQGTAVATHCLSSFFTAFSPRHCCCRDRAHQARAFFRGPTPPDMGLDCVS